MRSYDDKTLQTIGHLLDCDLALASSYLPLGDQVRLDLQLRNTRTGAVLDSFTQIAPRNKLAQAVTAAVNTLRHDLHLPPPAQPASTALPSLEAPGDGLREYAEGLRLVRAGRPNEAQPYLSRAVLASPHAPLAHIALASAWKSLGFDDRATAEARTALEQAPELATEQRLLLEAKAYNLIGNWQRAIDAYTTLRRLYPDTYIYTLGLAQAQLHAGKPKLAIDMLRDLTAHSVPAANDIYVLHTQTAATGGLADYRNMLLFAGQELRLARAQSSLYYQADALGYEGYAWNKLGDSEHAMADFREAERISTAIGDDLDLATVLRYMGDIQNTNLDPAAVTTLRRALAIQQKLGNHIAIIDCLVSLGNASLNQLDMQAARASFQAALQMSVQYHDDDRLTVVYNDLASIASSTGQPELELTYATKGLTMARQLQDPNSVAFALNFAGEAHETLGNLPAARLDYQQALQAAQSIGGAVLTVDILYSMASVELDAGNLTAAHQLIDRATAMHVHDDSSAIDLQLLAARLHIEDGQPALVDGPIAPVAPKYTTIQPAVAIEAWRLLAESALLRGDLNTAQADIAKALPLARKSPDLASGLIPVSVLAARIDAASNHQAKAYADLTALLRTAQHIQNVPLQLEIRLRQGEIERQRGNLAQSTRTLQSVQTEATRAGFGLLAQKAKKALAS
jgi:tetratricopeptide (TPR) repeat protein